MFKKENDFWFLVDKFRGFGIYKNNVRRNTDYLVCFLEYYKIEICFCTDSEFVYPYVRGRVAACPRELFVGWEFKPSLSLEIPNCYYKFDFLVCCLEKIKKEESIWGTFKYKNFKTISEYTYDVIYDLK